MGNTSAELQHMLDELNNLGLPEKFLFLESLIYSFTILARAIWSDEQSSDSNKIEAFKWLNELNHRIWNLRFEMTSGIDNDSITHLHKNMTFYGAQSTLLKAQLVPTFLSAFEHLKRTLSK